MLKVIPVVILLLTAVISEGRVALLYDAQTAKVTQFLLKYQVKDEFIRLGDVYLKNSNIGLRIEEAKVLKAFWPSEVFNSGKIELVQNNGDVLFSRDITPEVLQPYLVSSGDEYKNSYNNVRLNIPMKKNWLKKITTSGGVFFCLRHEKPEGGTEICSAPFKVSKGQLVVGSRNTATRVFLNGSQQASLIGEIPFSMEEPPLVQWFAQLQSGLSWSIKETVPAVHVIEVVEIDPHLYKISGYGARPLKYLNDHFTVHERPFFYEYKPHPFYNERGDYWTQTITTTKPIYISFFNLNGGVYTARIDIGKIPPLPESPIVLQNSHPQFTYSSKRNYLLELPPTAKVPENPALKATTVANRYEWSLTDLKRGEVSANRLGFKAGDLDRYYFLETFRGYPADIGFQYTLSTIGGSSANGGEMHASYWFEDMWGLASYDWLRLRLGIQMKYFKPQGKIPISVNTSGTTKKDAEVSSSIFDVKYRLQPGLWGRDETLGVLLAHHDFVFDDYKLGLLGGGLFWARSMPKYFDDMFNFFPFFRYPKWVSAELISFFRNSTPDLNLKYSYHLNFYGKVNWTPNIYGDLGFGMRSYSFSDSSRDREPLLNLFFLTMGLGFIF